jgi:hypothetical protein
MTLTLSLSACIEAPSDPLCMRAFAGDISPAEFDQLSMLVCCAA